MNILFLGGDKRYKFMMYNLLEKHSIHEIGFKNVDNNIYSEDISNLSLDNFDIILLPMGGINDQQEIKTENEKGSTYNVLVEPTFYHHIVSVHFVIYAYTGGAHDIRFDKVYYYDLEKNKEISIMDIVNFNDDFLDLLSYEAYQYLKKEKLDLVYDDEYLLKDGLSPTKENFDYLVFENNSLKIIFPPYQVGPWSSGEINALIPYQMIEDYLKV